MSYLLDTNIFVSAILSPDGAAREVLRRCLTSKYLPLIGNALFLEYEDVLSREKLFAAAPIGPADREALLDAFLGACQWIEIAFLWRPNLPDEADNHLIELAVAGNAEAIVTHNARDLAAGELPFDSIRIVAPGDLLKEEMLTWRP